MKKLTALLLAALALTSCTAGTDDIAEGLETFRDVYGGTPAPVQTEASDETETEPETAIPEEDLPVNYGTTVEGIVSDDFTINDGKMYFELQHRVNSKSGSHSAKIFAYIDLNTENYAFICPDPLCSHNNADTCRYLDLRYLHFTDEPGICYAVQYAEMPFRIYRVDLRNDAFRVAAEYDWFNTSLLGFTNGKMYLHERNTETEDKQTKVTRKISCIDHQSGDLIEVGNIPEQWADCQIKFLHDDEIWFIMKNGFYKTDPAFENVTKLFESPDGPINQQVFMDTVTGEVYFNVRDTEKRSGSVYVYREGKVSKINLPHNDIYYFTIDRNRIYYSTYDPIYYGISKTAYLAELEGKNVDIEDYKVYDYTSGKIYAVSRDNPAEEAELIYDNNGETMLCNSNHDYMVLGDYLYHDETAVIREVIGGREYVYFSSADQKNKIRVGLKDGSFTRISFD